MTISTPPSADVENWHPPDVRLPARSTRATPLAASLVAAFLVGAAGFLVLVVAAVGAGVLLTEVVLPGAVQRWDQGAVDTLVRGRPELNTWSLVGTYFGEAPTVIGLTLLLAVVCALRRRFEAAVFVMIALAIEGSIYLVVTFFVSRSRPHVHRMEQLVVSDSFFSGHVAASVVAWFGLAFAVWTMTRNRAWRAVACVPVIVAPVIVALSRTYRGMHYPTDVLAGYLVGWSCVLVGLLIVRTYRAHSAREDVEPGVAR